MSNTLPINTLSSQVIDTTMVPTISPPKRSAEPLDEQQINKRVSSTIAQPDRQEQITVYCTMKFDTSNVILPYLKPRSPDEHNANLQCLLHHYHLIDTQECAYTEHVYPIKPTDDSTNSITYNIQFKRIDISNKIHTNASQLSTVTYTTRKAAYTRVTVYGIASQWTDSEFTALTQLLNKYDAALINWKYQMPGILQNTTLKIRIPAHHKLELAQVLYQWFMSPQQRHLCKMFRNRSLLSIKQNILPKHRVCLQCYSTEHEGCSEQICAKCYSNQHTMLNCNNTPLSCVLCTVNNEPDVIKYKAANLSYKPHLPYKCPLYFNDPVILYPNSIQTQSNNTLDSAHHRASAYYYSSQNYNTSSSTAVTTRTYAAAANNNTAMNIDLQHQIAELKQFHTTVADTINKLDNKMRSLEERQNIQYNTLQKTIVESQSNTNQMLQLLLERTGLGPQSTPHSL